MNETDKILRFIQDCKTSVPECDSHSIEQFFANGYCYYFAMMLQSVFLHGEIVWLAPYAHIAWRDKQTGIVYDINGIYDVDASDVAYVIPVEFAEKVCNEFCTFCRHIPGRTCNLSSDDIRNICRLWCLMNHVEYRDPLDYHYPGTAHVKE